jgi:hypothetical protein
VIAAHTETPDEESIYGVWEGEYRGTKLLFRFDSDGTCLLNFRDNASGSTTKLSGNYELDFSKQPALLSITNIPQLNHPLHSIVHFGGNDSMKIAQFAPRWRLRPISFDPQTSISLSRTDKGE